MQRSFAFVVFFFGVSIGGLVAWTMTPHASTSKPEPAPLVTSAQQQPTPTRNPHEALLPALPMPAHTDVLIAGGGPSPEYNQISLEQDIAAIVALSPKDRTAVFFAGGPETRAVQVLDTEPRGSDVDALLGNFFDPRGGREAHYEPTSLRVHGAATRTEILGALQHALLDNTSSPLFVFLSGHGQGGDTRPDSQFLTWGEETITPHDIAPLLERSPARPVRFVITSCFSGGFSEMIFHGAGAPYEVIDGDHCGIFAAPWDLPASGCDPNPDRAAQEGYTAIFMNALRGLARNGTPLPREHIDFDGDGKISLAEAHARGVIDSESLDEPTTTSERFLEIAEAAVKTGTKTVFAWAENDAVIRELEAKYDVHSRQEAFARWEQNRAAAKALDANSELLTTEQELFHRAEAALLARYPVLNDPWHPDYVELVANHEDAILAFFENSPEIAAWSSAHERVESIAEQRDDLDVAVAPYNRLIRAYDARSRANQLAARGGRNLERFKQFLACERSVLPANSP